MPSKWAILIGIDFYTDPSRRLEGAVNDVDDIQLYLSQNHTLASLTKLVAINRNEATQTEPDGPESSWPTYDNITSELKRVTNAASPGDDVYIHYSGHGTLSPTTAEEYQEDFGSDAALVLFDRKNDVRYLRGIELAALLDEVVRKGLKLTVVLDCCHSGAVSRGGKLSIRGVPWDNDVASAYSPIYRPLSSTPTGNVNRDASTDQHWLLRPRGYTLIGACGPSEIAVECSGRDGRSHGALTYFLFKALSMASRNRVEITLGAIYRHICAELHVPLPQQHPVLLGNDTSIFLAAGSQDQRSTLGCSVTTIFEDGRISLDVGYAQMVCLGDEYEIYPMASIERDSTQNSARYRIKTVYALHSEAEQSHPPPNGASVSKGWYATLSKPFRAKAQVALSQGIDTTMEHILNQSTWLELVDSIGIVSSLPSFQVRITDRREYAIFIGGTERVQNLPITADSDPDATKRVVLVLEHLAKFANIEGLKNEDISSLIQFNPSPETISKDTVSQSCRSEFSVVLRSKDDANKQLVGNIFQAFDDERVTITFKNHTAQSLYLTVFDMKPLRQVSKLYPSSDRGYYKEIVPKSENFRGEVSFTIKMSIPNSLKTGNQSHVDDILKFFITTRPILTLLEALELPALSERMLVSKRGPNSDQVLLDFLENPYVLGGGGGRLRTENSKDRWTCQNFIIRTEVVSNHTTDN